MHGGKPACMEIWEIPRLYPKFISHLSSAQEYHKDALLAMIMGGNQVSGCAGCGLQVANCRVQGAAIPGRDGGAASNKGL